MINTFKTVEAAGYTVFSDSLNKINIDQSSSTVINTISPNSYGLALSDSTFKAALKHTDILVLDGVYFAFASLLLKGKNIKRNQGPDVFYHFLNVLNQKGGKAFFLGSSNETLDKIKRRASIEYPNIEVESFSPPFKPEFAEKDNMEMITAVNNFKPDILFIGMTCPKQEKWSISHKSKLDTKLIICIGNVFDWYAGTQKPIHPLWFKLRIGWLVRIFIRPEIFRRNIGNQMKFFGDIILIFFKLKHND